MGADSWACTKDVKSAMNKARSSNATKNKTERMTAARDIWQLEWHSEGRMIYLYGRADSAFWAHKEEDRYYCGQAE